MQLSENNPELGKIIAKAWRDPAFKAELIANPAAALKAEGIDVPAGMAVTVVENTDKQFHLVLPPVPTDELSDEALDGVAFFLGGKIIAKAWREPAFKAELIANPALRHEQMAWQSKTRSGVAPIGPVIPIPAIPPCGRSKLPIREPYRVMKYPGY
jgi:hypothetical protein